MTTADQVGAVEAMIDWCVPGFVEAARAARLPGAYRGERFWHGRATVERHRYWMVTLPVLEAGAGTAAITVGFDGAWAWVARPAAVVATTLDGVAAAFDATLVG